jgi:HPt (histidine-containing phosphotransfer) domain-containing protein
MREVLQLFLVHTEQVLEQLSSATDEKTWKQLTHTLKGSARGVGAFALADAAASAEKALLDRSAVEALRSAFVAAKDYIVRNPM